MASPATTPVRTVGGTAQPALTSRVAGPYLSVFRVVISLLFVLHGTASMFGIFGGAKGTGGQVAFGAWPSWWAAAIQLVAGGLVLLGLFTRPAALLCSGSMAYAYFTVHAPKSLWLVVNGGEAAALYSWAFLTIGVLGAGAWSSDGMLARHRV